MAELSLAPLKRIVQAVTRTGRKPMIGKEAMEKYREEVERYASELAVEAACTAARGGRQTIKSHDMETAVKHMNPEPDWKWEIIKKGRCPDCFGHIKDAKTGTDPSYLLYDCLDCGERHMFLRQFSGIGDVVAAAREEEEIQANIDGVQNSLEKREKREESIWALQQEDFTLHGEEEE